MTNEEEKLLLKDLAARVPYGVMVEQTLFPSDLADKEQRLKSVQANNCVKLYWYKYIDEFVPIHCIKPYLRPMSSITEEEEKELGNFVAAIMFASLNKDPLFQLTREALLGDFFNKHHIDYRGLIEMGLALEATVDMYKIK